LYYTAVVISNGNAQNRGIKMQQNCASPKARQFGAAKIKSSKTSQLFQAAETSKTKLNELESL
jgi:hypothetical protein